MRKLFNVLACAVLVIFTGCGAPAKNQTSSQPQLSQGTNGAPGRMDPSPQASANISNHAFDRCANHLHDDVCAALLLYLSSHADQTPATLAELKQVPGFDDLELICPVSHQPYGYAPNGLIIPGEESRIVVYDSSPAHGGIRWGIRIVPRIAGRPPSATVVPMTEEMFSKLQQP